MEIPKNSLEQIALNELLKGISEILERLDVIEKNLFQSHEQLIHDESTEKLN
ncbi:MULTISPECIES: hypothetical protein [unclassified Granulicatella]|uniref:hypothetical protein n=1 Tax=unclassified Granulicatella TaxID=2630493 RepID=UPI001430B57A|nr:MULTISPECIES: hypothetical protein [unclassified Granulicatella]MBF0781154.1 hypothetical protein [Granulicatella sp. 19428wC4_WM01]